MKTLTKAEEQIMYCLWKIKKGFVKDIINQFPDPKPAYTTITTIIRVMVKKGYIQYNSYGKIHEYYPVFSQNEYMKHYFKGIIKKYFNNSYKKFVSFFAHENELSLSDLEEIKTLVIKQIEKKKELGKF